MGVLGKGKDEEGAQSNSRKSRKLKKKKPADFALIIRLNKKKKKNKHLRNIIIYFTRWHNDPTIYVTVVVAAN